MYKLTAVMFIKVHEFANEAALEYNFVLSILHYIFSMLLTWEHLNHYTCWYPEVYLYANRIKIQKRSFKKELAETYLVLFNHCINKCLIKTMKCLLLCVSISHFHFVFVYVFVCKYSVGRYKFTTKNE